MKIVAFFDKTITNIAKFFIVIGVLALIISFGFNVLNQDKREFTNPVDIQKKQSEKLYQQYNQAQNSADKPTKLAALVTRTVSCSMIGELCSDKPNESDKYFSQSWFGFASNLIMLPYNIPPASASYALNETLTTHGLVPAAFAAEGIGFSSIKPIAKIWKVFRDFAYIAIVLFLVIMGFMIMFRMKLNPQTVIGIENSLPKIVVALILITFSFAIAGFLIDMMYVLIAIGISLLTNVGVGDLVKSNTQFFQNKYIGAGMGALWPYKSGREVFFDTGTAMFNIFPGWIRFVISYVIGYLLTLTITTKIVGLPKTLITALSDWTLPGGADIGWAPQLILFALEALVFIFIFPFIPGIFLGLLMFITLFFFMFRVFFQLLASYLKIIMFIIFAPIILLFVAIPGKNTFSFWIKNLIGELMVFPIIILVSLVGYAIYSLTISNETLFRPPFLYEIPSEAFGSIIGIGLILMIPKLMMAVREAFGVKPGLGVGPGIFFGGIGAIGGGAFGTAMQIGSLHMGIAGLKGLVEGIQNKRTQAAAERAARALAGQATSGGGTP